MNRVAVDSKYHGMFDNLEDVISNFSLSPSDLEEEDVIYATYDAEGYDGSAHVIFSQGNVLYEVNDSHCSCNGLENWSPEETTISALLARPNVADKAKANLKIYYKNTLPFL